MHHPLEFNSARIERESTGSFLTLRKKPFVDEKRTRWEWTVLEWERYVKRRFPDWILICCGDDID